MTARKVAGPLKPAVPQPRLPTVSPINRAPQGPAPQPVVPASPVPAAAPVAPRDPRDSLYGAAIANLQQQHDHGVAGINQQETNLEQDLIGPRGTLARLGEGRTAALAGNEVTANKQGLFYSGILGKRQGDTNQQYNDRQLDATTGATRQAQQYEAQKAGLDDALQSGRGSAYQDAIQRAIAADQADSTLGVTYQDDGSAGVAPDPWAATNATRPGPINQGGSGLAAGYSIHNVNGRPTLFGPDGQPIKGGK